MRSPNGHVQATRAHRVAALAEVVTKVVRARDQVVAVALIARDLRGASVWRARRHLRRAEATADAEAGRDRQLAVEIDLHREELVLVFVRLRLVDARESNAAAEQEALGQREEAEEGLVEGQLGVRSTPPLAFPPAGASGSGSGGAGGVVAAGSFAGGSGALGGASGAGSDTGDSPGVALASEGAVASTGGRLPGAIRSRRRVRSAFVWPGRDLGEVARRRARSALAEEPRASPEANGVSRGSAGRGSAFLERAAMGSASLQAGRARSALLALPLSAQEGVAHHAPVGGEELAA